MFQDVWQSSLTVKKKQKQQTSEWVWLSQTGFPPQGPGCKLSFPQITHSILVPKQLSPFRRSEDYFASLQVFGQWWKGRRNLFALSEEVPGRKRSGFFGWTHGSSLPRRSRMAGSRLSAVCSSPPPPLCSVCTPSSRLESGCSGSPRWPEPPYTHAQSGVEISKSTEDCLSKCNKTHQPAPLNITD